MTPRLAPVAALRPLGALWGWLAKTRRELYEAGFFRKEAASRPVVSVGNLTLGGNGKTPMCAFLAKSFASLGLSPAIVSRGHRRRRLLPDPLVVSKGSGPLVSELDAGDEPYLLSILSPAIVACAKKRILAARKAEELGADVLILDDGFQHLRLHRDVDVLMLRSPTPWDAESLIVPAGPLREPPEALSAASVIVTIGEPPGQDLRLLAGPRPLFEAKLVPSSFSCLASGRKLPLDYPKKASKGAPRIMAFCGLANPQSFYDDLAGLDLAPECALTLPDHARYGSDALSSLRGMVSGHRPDFLITTAKDAVKFGYGLETAGLSGREQYWRKKDAPEKGSLEKDLFQKDPPPMDNLGLSLSASPSEDSAARKTSSAPLLAAALGRQVLVLETSLKVEKGEELMELLLEKMSLAGKLRMPKSPKAGFGKAGSRRSGAGGPEAGKFRSAQPEAEGLESGEIAPEAIS